MSDHHHHHDHHQELGFEEKLQSLFSHWIDHNNSHKDSYLSWAHKASHEGLDQIKDLLEEVAAMSDQVTQKLEQALDLLKK
ncbi:MAG: hypothetical protein D3926_13070 [Desulfobacteraceae bacterium]|nr:MAG: hypothetical protein D3926_13070 [Desulfobacteraceae bacterium]